MKRRHLVLRFPFLDDHGAYSFTFRYGTLTFYKLQPTDYGDFFSVQTTLVQFL
jgi:hypothetical protein